ncbi:hypothetical protein [Leptospira idonii]|nr:hypothetical protein [Leptospira idonii]
MYVLIYSEISKLRSEYKHLSDPGSASKYSSFATIQEISRIKNSFPIIYQCHYSFALENGALMESSETIPYDIYKKLKLGDSIEISRKETSLFGRKIALSKIKANEETPPLIENLERFFRGALSVFTILAGLSLLFRAWGLQSRSYLSQQK